MSWLEHHTRSEKYASDADVLCREQEAERAVGLYSRAAYAELKALEELDSRKTRTLGIIVISATSLLYKAHDFLQARRIAHKWLATELLPSFAEDELEELLQVIRYEESRVNSGVQFVQGEVLVSVSGGEILYGAAPLELILDKVKSIKSIFYRTTEYLLEQPLRTSGGPTQLIKDYCDPWLLQAPPGSYQFAVRVRKPQDYEQLKLAGMPGIELHVEEITKKFLEIIRTAAQDPEGEFSEVVHKKRYRESFLKLTRQLAPPVSGKSFEQMEIKSSSDIEAQPVFLSGETRETIKKALTVSDQENVESREEKIIQLRGVLRGLQLDIDWIEVSTGQENIRIYDAQDEIDDVIGPMVNRRVVVDVIERPDNTRKRYLLRDIQLEDDV